MTAAPTVISIVPHSSGNTPNELGFSSGTQRVPKKNSSGLTLRKNSTDSTINNTTMARVVNSDSVVQMRSQSLMVASPQRVPPLRMLELRLGWSGWEVGSDMRFLRG